MKNLFSEGKYWDVWSILHFLSGYLIGFTFLGQGSGFAIAFVVVVIASVAFEVVETLLKVDESSANKAIDLALGILGYIIGYLIFADCSLAINYFVISIAGVVYLSVVIPGWLRYMKEQKIKLT